MTAPRTEELAEFHRLYDATWLDHLRSYDGPEKQVKDLQYYLTSPKPAAVARRGELEWYLRVAKQHGKLTKDACARLRPERPGPGCWKTFLETRDELMAGYHLQEKVGLKIAPDPPAPRTKGDWSILWTPEVRIFVEVKTIVEVDEAGGATPFNNIPLVEQAINDARGLLPTDRPSLVILCSETSFSLFRDEGGGVEDALYGSPVIRQTLAPATLKPVGNARTDRNRARSHFSSPDANFADLNNARISAAAVLGEYMPWTEEPLVRYRFTVYHNPMARHPIPEAVFNGWPQLVADDARNGMVWHVHPLQKKIVEVARRHGAQDVRVVGSVARGDASPGSDLDLLVRMEQGRSTFDLVDLQDELRDLLQRDVDVISEAGASPYMRGSLEEQALPL